MKKPRKINMAVPTFVFEILDSIALDDVKSILQSKVWFDRVQQMPSQNRKFSPKYLDKLSPNKENNP